MKKTGPLRTEVLIEQTVEMMYIHDKAERVGNCLFWLGSKDSYGVPLMRKPGARNFSPVRRVILELKGVDIGNKLASTKCGNPQCICEKHILPMTRKQLQIRTAKTTNYAKSPARCAAIAMKRRERAVLTIEKVAEMRASGLTTREAGRVYGVAQSTAASIMAHKVWKDYSNPFAGLMR